MIPTEGNEVTLGYDPPVDPTGHDDMPSHVWHVNKYVRQNIKFTEDPAPHMSPNLDLNPIPVYFFFNI